MIADKSWAIYSIYSIYSALSTGVGFCLVAWINFALQRQQEWIDLLGHSDIYAQTDPLLTFQCPDGIVAD